MPRLNALGENMAQARVLNSELRLQRLLELHSEKSAKILAKEQQRKKRGEKRLAKQAKNLQKLHAKDQQREVEQPAVDVLIEFGFLQREEGKPTVRVLKSFCSKQGLKPGARSRADLMKMILEAIKSKPDHRWQSADQEAVTAEASDSDCASISSNNASSDDEDDLSDWGDTRILL